MSLLTKKIPTILGLALLLAGVAGGVMYLRANQIAPNASIVPEKVRITNVSDNKFSVSWISQSPTIGLIEYGVVGESLTNKAYDDRDSPEEQNSYLTHHITVSSLQPNTQYAFRILTGDSLTRFDNNGSPYSTTTGPSIASTPPSSNFYGNVVLPSSQAASGAIVYLTLPEGTTASSLVPDSGNYAFTLSTIRSSDLRSYVNFDPSATIANVVVESGELQATSDVSLVNSAPVPTITLGQNIDYLNAFQTPVVAEVTQEEEETEEIGLPEPSIVPETPSILNVEPIVSENQINQIGTGSVVILNPKEAGETLMTLRPEFRGTGIAGLVMAIAITGQKAISDSVEVEDDGTWSWSPVIDLREGKQTVTLTYNNASGVTQKVSREFNVSMSPTGLDPAFVASPSASTPTSTPIPQPSATAVASPSASVVASVSATPRTTMPDTEEGVPVSGVIDKTLWGSAMGILLLLAGIILVAI